MGDNMNIIDDAKSVIFTIWFDKLRGIHREIHRAYNDELFTAKHEIHVRMTWQFHEGRWPYILEWCFNRRQVHDWLTILMGVGMMHTINQRIILRRIQERKSFIMNQAIPHLGAGSSLMNDASSNCRRQPGMGTAFTVEWMASTWMSQCIGRTKKALGYKQGHPMTMEHQRRGDLYFESGKDACISSNLIGKKNHLHIFLNCYRKILNEVQQDGGKRKKHCGDDNKESVLIME